MNDVNPEAYYAPYIEWAVAAGILKGDGNGTFRPDDEITRQDVAVILYRYVDEHLGMAFDMQDTHVVYADAVDIAAYAARAVDKFSSAGILSGADGAFNPTDPATRAQVAKIITQYALLLDSAYDKPAEALPETTDEPETTAFG
jgi:hypothetical protein